MDFDIWGLDRGFVYVPEMLLDRQFSLQVNPTSAQKTCYEDAKKLIRKNRFKNKVKGTYQACWYQSNQIINDCLDTLGGTSEAYKIIADLRASWDIYFKSASGLSSNQPKANYMEQNFEAYYNTQSESKPKVFLKFGSVHLIRGISPFGVDDMGKFLTEKAKKNNTGFLSIRQMLPY